MLTHKLSSGARRLTTLALCLLFANGALAAERHSLWIAKGNHNTVYLFGSMHMLPASEALPDEVNSAYRDARKIVMEIDLDDLNPFEAQKAMMDFGMLPAGETLAEKMGPEGMAKVTAYAKENGIDPSVLQQFRPWFAAMMLTQFHFAKQGFDPQSGVEQRFVARAGTDRKEILGLETLADQLHLLADLPMELQKQFLLQSISDMKKEDEELGEMLVAWRNGDADKLEKSVVRGMREFPQLYKPLTVDRNRRWLAQLQKMLEADENYLVIVGALHLVGKDGVVDLLQSKGYKVEQH